MDEQRGGSDQSPWADPARPGGGASHRGPDFTSPGPYPGQLPASGAAGPAGQPAADADSPWSFGAPYQPGPVEPPGGPVGSSGGRKGQVARRVGFALVTAAALAVGVVGVAAAVDPSPSPTPTPGTTTPSPGSCGQNGAGPYAFMHRGPGGMFGSSIHGQFVVPKSGGGYQTMDQQRGDVTAVSSTSISVRSENGFTKTYAVTATTVVTSTRDGIGDVKKGDQVSVMAVEENGSATAVHILDITQVGAEWHRYGPAPRPGTSGWTEPSGTFGRGMAQLD